MAAGAPEVTPADWEAAVLPSEQPVLVDFWSPSCLPCRAVAPVIGQLAAELKGRVRVLQCDVTRYPELADRCGVMKVPALLLFVNGAPAGELTPGSKEALRAQLEQAAETATSLTAPAPGSASRA